MDFLVYATVFRLSVIAAGTLFMYFGYRLFLYGIIPDNGAEIGSEAGQIKLTVKNAAPGTCFSLFGMLLIGVMIWQSSPQMNLTETTADNVVRQVTMRGPSQAAAFDLRAALNSRNSASEQIATYASQLRDPDLRLREAAAPILGLATAYLRGNRNEEAIALVRLVYQFAGDQPETLALTALVENARGDKGTAMTAARRLNDIHPDQMDLIETLKLEVTR